MAWQRISLHTNNDCMGKQKLPYRQNQKHVTHIGKKTYSLTHVLISRVAGTGEELPVIVNDGKWGNILSWPNFTSRVRLNTITSYHQSTRTSGDFQGAQMAEPPLLKSLFDFGLNPPNFLLQSCFSKCNDLASDVLYGIPMINFLTSSCLLRIFVDAGFIISNLD